ncbi:MAG TPA: DUF2946 family protein [Burkholderiales bacterium]|nr:DUF2946 family protein [Burkholderiales bacterium]
MIRRQIATYLAVLAIAIQGFGPLLQQGRASSVVLVPLCTVDGVTHYLELPAAPAKQGAPGQHEHCSLCTVGADRLAFLPALDAKLFVPSAASARPPMSSAKVLQSQALRFSRPRAPPASA